jgi:hypothetical protein
MNVDNITKQINEQGERLKFSKVFVQYGGDGELINITDLDIDRYETFLAGMSYLNGQYVERIRNARIERQVFGNLKL